MGQTYLVVLLQRLCLHRLTFDLQLGLEAPSYTLHTYLFVILDFRTMLGTWPETTSQLSPP